MVLKDIEIKNKKKVAKKNNGGYISANVYGCVAQLVEQLTLNQWVWGSNPHAPTIRKAVLRKLRRLFFIKFALSHINDCKKIKIVLHF